MGDASTYLQEREAELERRRGKARREQARREAREAKRAPLVVSDLGALDTLLERAGGTATVEANGAGAPSLRADSVVRSRRRADATTPAKNPDGTTTASHEMRPSVVATDAGRPPACAPTFAERRQAVADQARDRATAAVTAEAGRRGERRTAEREMATRALRTLWKDAHYAEERRRIELALAADDPDGVRSAARRALWSAAGDAALRPGTECEAELSVCTALAVIEWLPISSIRAGRKHRLAVGVPAGAGAAAFRERAMAAQTLNGGGEKMEHWGGEAFVVRLRDRCEPRLSGGYEGGELEVPVGSRELAQALVGALLERNLSHELGAGVCCKPLAGGTRTVTVEPVG